MSNYEEKEAQALAKKLPTFLNKLDASLEELGSLDEDTKKHSMKKWIVEKAIHEIKKIAHEAGKYDKYDEKRIRKKEMDLLEKVYVKSASFLFNSYLIFESRINRFDFSRLIFMK